MTPELLEAILAHAQAEAPREACGILVWDGKNDAIYRPCRNIAEADHFDIHPEDWVSAEDAGQILGIVHSHPGGTTYPSHADFVACNRSNVPWWIVTLDGQWRRIIPSDWQLTGHPFAWGVQDCWTLVRDAAFGRVPDFLRTPEFWERENLFMDHLEEAGWRIVEDGPVHGDGLLFSIRGRGVVNHCAVYRGAGRIVHHLPGRLSREEDLGPLNRAVVHVVRRMA